MISRRIVVNIAFFAAAFGLMSMWAINNIVSIDAIERPYPISARFSNAFGVLPNAEVTYRGVAYGRVTDVSRVDGGGVEVQMEIDRGQQVPAMAGAMIARKSAIGEPYVDLTPPEGYAGGGPFLAPGSTIPTERTAVPLEFSELLRSAGALISSLPPDHLSTVVAELADGLEGRADSLRQLAISSDELAATFATRTEALDRLLTNNARVTAVLAAERGSLGAVVHDLALLAETLRRSSGSSTLLLDRGSQLMDQLSTLVDKHKANLDCDLGALERIVELSTTDSRLAGLAATLDLGPEAFALFWDTRDIEDDGPWIRVGAINNSSNPPAQYVPPREPPPTRPAVACGAALRASGQDYLPAGRAGGDEGRTTPGSAVGALVVAAAILGVRSLRGRAGAPYPAR